MSDNLELKLECLRLAGGDVRRAQEIFEWVNAPTPDKPPVSGVEKEIFSRPGSAGDYTPRVGYGTCQAVGNGQADLNIFSALTPPLQHKGGETEAGDKLAEFMKREGAKKWDGGYELLFALGDVIEVFEEGGKIITLESGDAHLNLYNRILAYRIISSSEADSGPRSEAIAGDARIEQTISTLQASSGEGEVNPLTGAYWRRISLRDVPAGAELTVLNADEPDVAVVLARIVDLDYHITDLTASELEATCKGWLEKEEREAAAAETPTEPAHSADYQLGRSRHFHGFERPGDDFYLNANRTKAIQAGWDSSKADNERDDAWAAQRDAKSTDTPTEPAAYSPVNNADEPFVDDTVAGSFARGKDRELELAAEADAAIEAAKPPETPSEPQHTDEGTGDRVEQINSITDPDADFFAKGFAEDAKRKAAEEKPGFRLFGGIGAFGKREVI